jgi:RNA polymerase sigma-70 factor, ECF subfamily
MADDPLTPEDAAARHARDLELVRRVLRGEREAQEQFLARMQCVRRFLSARNASFGRPLRPDELEDTLQSTLLALWAKLSTFAGTGSLEAWAYRFSYLELLNRLQALRRRPSFLEDVGGAALAEPRGAEPFEHGRLYRALARLEPAAAEVLRQKNLEGRTFEELAAREKVSVNTIKTRYYRALERLRGLLGAERDPALTREEA